jgi:hypothetical protein
MLGCGFIIVIYINTVECLGCRGAPFHHPYLRSFFVETLVKISRKFPIKHINTIMPSDFPWQVILMGPRKLD